VIYRRREAELVRTGFNIMWEPLAKGMILSLPWFSWYVSWNRHTRRVHFAVPTGFNWRTPIGPWRRIRELEAQLRALDHALHQSNDRYDKVRDMNDQLRRALTLYRNA
jgi:hypothetical protein